MPCQQLLETLLLATNMQPADRAAKHAVYFIPRGILLTHVNVCDRVFECGKPWNVC